jgi:hypothetical protein
MVFVQRAHSLRKIHDHGNHLVTTFAVFFRRFHGRVGSSHMKQRRQGVWKAKRVFAKNTTGELARQYDLPSTQRASTRLLVGRHEWVSLPDLGPLPWMAKTDTGARTSTLHATHIKIDERSSLVSFETRDHTGAVISCTAPLSRFKIIRNSTGGTQNRVIIRTTATFAGGLTFPIELTLADRSHMKCPMLLGRRAISGYFLVDPQSDYLLGHLDDFPTVP